jgi:TRAP-type C4-dicarboxylate transport system substrate-binding protein
MLAPSEWLPSLEKGLIDGVAMGISGIPMYNLQDVVNYHIQPTGDSLGLNGTSFIMNRKKFESLPAGAQKVIEDSVMWASKRVTAIEMDNIPKQLEICRKAGNEIIALTRSEMMKWYVTIRPLHQQWIRKMEAMGLPGKKVYDEAKRLAEKYKTEQ